jgi:hypothetical protein
MTQRLTRNAHNPTKVGKVSHEALVEEVSKMCLYVIMMAIQRKNGVLGKRIEI